MDVRPRGKAARRLAAATALTALVAVVGAGPIGARTDAPSRPVVPVADPAGLVDTLDGTATGPVSPGTVGEFPGADLPFGMIQWSPDSLPGGTASGGGYAFGDTVVNGFSLTHLSGTGCPSYWDVPILPTVGPVGAAPATATASFSHATERASPGEYGVTLGPSGVSTRLAVTTRTGLSRFTYPATREANVLVKVADSANPASASSVRLVGRTGLDGQVTSGGFCGTGTPYTLYFAARFDRPFATAGNWDGPVVSPGAPVCTGTACGEYVTFDTRSDRVVQMKVGISFVSQANAAANLRAEDPGWSLARVEDQATRRWNALLGRIGVGGGAPATQRTFYTALYHSLLDPNVVSDADGEYPGADGRVHRAAHRSQYADFSEWDIYRSEIELVSLVAPHQAGDMVQSLVNDAGQGGWLPKWAIVGGDESQMNGDSADPIIAAAYAFGVRNFDVHAALAAMVKGADQYETGHGLQIERQYLDQYLAQHYVDAGSLDLTSIDYSIGGSVTLEYALDDFAVARLARARGDRALEAAMMRRAHNWEYLFNPATGYLQARGADGSFPAGPAFQPSQFEPGGQLGFEEGNAVQYTWSVPQDLSALGAMMGGDAAATAALDTFFTSLNAGRYQPYDWAGNEPDLWAPWEYDSFGAPWKTQATVRKIADRLYADAPADEPGNDDLGALSSWYVWAAMGMYPVTPGTSDLALASPIFPKVVVALPDGRRLVLDAPRASPSTPYIHSLTVTGTRPPGPAATVAACPGAAPPARAPTGWNRPWLPASIIRTGGLVTFGVSSVPDPAWGAGPSARPPSYGTGGAAAVGFTAPSGATVVRVGQPATIELGAVATGTAGARIEWSAGGPGLAVSPPVGHLVIGGPSRGAGQPSTAGCFPPPPATRVVTLTATTPGPSVLTVRMTDARSRALPPVVVDVTATG